MYIFRYQKKPFFFFTAFHPRIDVIYGYNSSSGDVYGYSNLDKTYIMHWSVDKTWYSVPDFFYTRVKDSVSFCNDKVVLPRCDTTVDIRRREARHPLEQSKLTTKTAVLASMSLYCLLFTSFIYRFDANFFFCYQLFFLLRFLNQE